MYQFSTPLTAANTASVQTALSNSVAVAMQQLADAARQARQTEN